MIFFYLYLAGILLWTSVFFICDSVPRIKNFTQGLLCILSVLAWPLVLVAWLLDWILERYRGK